MGYIDQQQSIQSNFFGNKGGGLFNKVSQDYFLKKRIENLFDVIPGSAKAATDYFQNNKIKWWRGEGNEPTNHTLSSQVACVNHLFWLMENEDAATEVLKGIDPEFTAIPFYNEKNPNDKRYVVFEYDGFDLTPNIGKNIIGENRRSRGATSTSIDAAILAQKGDKKILVCIEWKYIENYGEKAIEKTSNRYIHQKDNYKGLLMRNDSPIKLDLLRENSECSFDKEYIKFSVEPFYQLMRQTLLAWQLLEKIPSIADDYIHIHIIPNGNIELLNGKTSTQISRGVNICDGWKNYLKDPNKYMHIDPQKFIGTSAHKYNEKLFQYLLERYWK